MILFSFFLLFQTERAFSGHNLYETRPGIYLCIHCKNKLFSSKDKYDSGAGWPSFSQPIETQSVYYLKDPEPTFQRYLVLCRGCDSSLGHVFNDGPPPKGLRYCIQSMRLFFEESLAKP